MKLSLPKAIGRYIIEAILIFISVYAAFVLESKRSKSFEREVLIGRLERLVAELKFDSMKYADFILPYDSTKTGPSTGINIIEDIYYDSLSILFIRSKDSLLIDSVFFMWKNGRVMSHWDENWVESLESESSIMSQILELQHLFYDPDFRGTLYYINDERETYITHNKQNIEIRNDLGDHFVTELPIYDSVINYQQKRAFVTSTLFLNSLNLHINSCKELLYMVKARGRWSGEEI